MEISQVYTKIFLKDMRRRARMQITPQLILTHTADVFGIPEHRVLSKDRQRKLVSARIVAIALSRELTSATVKQLGRFFGNRDHSTICHSSESFAAMLTLKDEHSQFVIERYHETKKSIIENGYF